MSVWIRNWQKCDIQQIADSLLVVGLLNAECFPCHKIGISKDSLSCPECGKKFEYIGFRKKVAARDLEPFSQHKDISIIEFDDFLKEFNRNKARKLFDSN